MGCEPFRWCFPVSTRLARNHRSNGNGSEQERLAQLWRAAEESQRRLEEVERKLEESRREPKEPIQIQVTESPAADALRAEAHALLEVVTSLRHDGGEAAAFHSEIHDALVSAREAGELAGALAQSRREHAREVDALRDERRAAEAARDDERGRALRAENELAHAMRALGALEDERDRLRGDLDVERSRRVGAERALSRARQQAERDAEKFGGNRARLALREERASALPPVWRVSDIPGVERGEIEALRALGIKSVGSLIPADLSSLTRATRIGVARLAKLRSLSELLSIRGVDSACAAALFAAGYRRVGDVAASPPERVGDAVSRAKRALSAEDRVAFGGVIVREAQRCVTNALSE